MIHIRRIYMSIKLDSYKIFGVVAEHKSFSQAAKVLFMTQPAISQAVSQLERELDTRLFKRTRRGVTLTDEGHLLYEYVHSAIGLIDVAEEKILEFKNLTAGELKIGVADTISRYFLLHALEKFHNTYPNVKFRIVNGTTFELCNTLKKGDVDIAICKLPIDDPDLELCPCIDLQDTYVCGDYVKYFVTKTVNID